MAKKKGVKKAIKAAASGGITKEEFKTISEQYNVTPQSIVQKADKINKKAKAKGGTPFVSLNSGAANMLIRQAGKTTSPYLQPSYGSGRIGRSLQSMIGTPNLVGPRNPQSGAPSYNIQGTPGTGLMIGGTQIRPGGRVSVQGFGSSPRATGLPSGAAANPVDTDPTDTDEYWNNRREQRDVNRAAGQGRVAAMRDAVNAFQDETTAPSGGDTGVADSASSIDGMTGGGMGISGATGLRRPNSRWRQQRRTSKGTNNFRRSLQIGSPINLA